MTLLGIWSVIHYSSYINPLTIFILPNLLSIILMLGSNWMNKTVPVSNALTILLTMVFFTLGACFSDFIKTSDKVQDKDDRGYALSMGFFSIVYDIAAILYLRSMNASFGLQTMFSNLTAVNIAQQSGELNGVFSYILPLSFPVSIWQIRILKNTKKRKLGKTLGMAQLVLCYLPYVFTARRSTLFSLATFDGIYLLVKYRISSSEGWSLRQIRRTALIAVASYALVLFMSRTQQLMGKSGSGNPYSVFGILLPPQLIDSIGYIAGNYAYYMNAVEPKYYMTRVTPMLATLRVLYLYLLPYFGIAIDAVTPFANQFVDIGANGFYYPFNTVPIYYYLLLDAGLFYPFVSFVIGVVTNRAYKALQKKAGLSSEIISTLILMIVFWSFRGYDMIYLVTWLIVGYSIAIQGFSAVLSSVETERIHVG